MGRRKITCALFALCWAGPALGNVITYDDLPSFLAGTGSLTLESFDASPWSPVFTDLPQPVVSLGVGWTASERLQAVGGGNWVSSPHSISSIDDDTGTTDAIQAVLPGGIRAVGGWVGNAIGNDVTLTAFDARGGVIGSVTAALEPTGFQFVFVGLTARSPIASVEFLSTQGEFSDDFVLDDFYFGVPAPPGLALLILGVAGPRRARPRRGQDGAHNRPRGAQAVMGR